MDERFRMRLYAITSVACAAWLVQTVNETTQDGTIATAPSLILLVCLAVAVVYTGVNAFLLWRRPVGDDPDDVERDAEDDAHDTDDMAVADDKEAR